MIPLKKTSLNHYLSPLKKDTKSNRLFQKEKTYRSRQKKRMYSQHMKDDIDHSWISTSKIPDLPTASISEENLFHPMSPNYEILPGPIFLSRPTTSMLAPRIFYPINRSEIVTGEQLPRCQPPRYKKKISE